MGDPQDTLDLSNKKLKKLNKPTPSESQVQNLILDNNDLQRLDNIDSFTKLVKLSAIHNQLLRMYGVCRLHSLQTLNLSHNGILTIEGLKELVNLKWLCLAGNSIKTIEHLNTNINLEHVDLSENSITHISDISFLKNLKELFLHKNKINHLNQCDRFLPTTLTILTLANNNIGDLNEISRLVNLVHLTKISIANNPCVNMTGNNVGFDYRPFVINWCLNVNVIDDYVVDAIESLRAEWLYSQGRGRHFRVGDQKELAQYLATVCPLTGEALETEEDRKLRLILSKAQHHQQQLREQSSTNATPNPSPLSRKKLHPNKQSPRLSAGSRLSNRNKSPDRMSSSCYNSNLNDNNTSHSVMSQSLDPTILSQSIAASNKTSNDSINNYILSEKCLDSEPVNSPLQALSKMVPVPESLMSPDYRPLSFASSTTTTKSTGSTNKSFSSSPKNVPATVKSNKSSAVIAKPRNNINAELRKTGGGSPSPVRQRKTNNTDGSSKSSPAAQVSSDDDDEEESEVCDAKLQTIQMKLDEHNNRLQKKEEEDVASNCSSSNNNEDRVEQAVVFIQKMWRGFYTRNKNKEVQEMFKELQSQRANQYIQKLATDMETTKAALESERKIQMLQTEAISALWKKISVLQPSSSDVDANVATGSLTSSSSNMNMTNLSINNAEVVKQLAQTCTMLQSQIQQLQNSMQDIVKVMTVFSQTTGLNNTNNQQQQMMLTKDHHGGIATQTEIVAVHTPQGEAGKLFPFQKQPNHPQQQMHHALTMASTSLRPSSLPLPIQHKKKDAVATTASNNGIIINNQELQQFAGIIVEGVIKNFAEEGRADTNESTNITQEDMVVEILPGVNEGLEQNKTGEISTDVSSIYLA